MKRSVAIIGPTPQFVRWAIEQSCPLRELDFDNLTDSTFRQLRGLREYSIGVIENRVFEDFCVHPDSVADDIDQVRGFHANEVLAAHGDAHFVENCCKNCPANAIETSRPDIWAGCYGWLPATSGISIESRLRNTASLNEIESTSSEETGRFDFVKLIDDVVESFDDALAGHLFLKTTPRWFGLWKNPTLSQAQAEFLRRVFESAVSRCNDLGANAAEVADLNQFRDALKRSVEHRRTLHVELVPPGNSDGQTWTIAAHCPDCKMAMSDAGRQKCSACGRVGNPSGQRKSKVLGLRPYVNLVGVMGVSTTTEFMKRFESRTTR